MWLKNLCRHENSKIWSQVFFATSPSTTGATIIINNNKNNNWCVNLWNHLIILSIIILSVIFVKTVRHYKSHWWPLKVVIDSECQIYQSYYCYECIITNIIIIVIIETTIIEKIKLCTLKLQLNILLMMMMAQFFSISRWRWRWKKSFHKNSYHHHLHNHHHFVTICTIIGLIIIYLVKSSYSTSLKPHILFTDSSVVVNSAALTPTTSATPSVNQSYHSTTTSNFTTTTTTKSTINDHHHWTTTTLLYSTSTVTVTSVPSVTTSLVANLSLSTVTEATADNNPVKINSTAPINNSTLSTGGDQWNISDNNENQSDLILHLHCEVRKKVCAFIGE